MSQFTGWAIDRDYITEPGDSVPSRVGYGQRSATDVHDDADCYIGRRVTVSTELRAAAVTDPVRFRVLDDDGEVYYGGAISRAWLDGDEDLAFAPLTFASADAGATELQYRYTSHEEWRTL